MNETKLRDWAQLVLVQCTSTKENSHNLLDQDFDWQMSRVVIC